MKAIKIYNGQIYNQRIAGQEVTSALLRQERFYHYFLYHYHLGQKKRLFHHRRKVSFLSLPIL